MSTIHRPGEPFARRTMYRGIPMRSRLEARAAQFLDSVPGAQWAYEPVAYADETGQYLPDFEAVGLVDYPLVIEVKGAATVEDQQAIRAGMRRVWSSLPGAGITIWTGAVIEEGVPFEVERVGIAPVSLTMRSCALCGRGLLIEADGWTTMFVAAVCEDCEASTAA